MTKRIVAPGYKSRKYGIATKSVIKLVTIWLKHMCTLNFDNHGWMVSSFLQNDDSIISLTDDLWLSKNLWNEHRDCLGTSSPKLYTTKPNYRIPINVFSIIYFTKQSLLFQLSNRSTLFQTSEESKRSDFGTSLLVGHNTTKLCR